VEEQPSYPAHNFHYCIDDYNPTFGYWIKCPNCGLRPRIWIYDNGRSTACGCWENKYDHFSIHAESIMSVVKRTSGSIAEYNQSDLMKNWNHWCKTGEELFKHAMYRDDGRW
jgi:hypothetical protein